MNMFLFLMILISSEKTLEVRYTDVAPRIDGVIEDVWQKADSAYNFVQHIPYEKTDPTEKTVVYILQDKENLYFAFHCYAEKNRPTACLTRDEDYVRVGIDPFGSKTTGYYFLVFGSQLFWDGWVLEDGRVWDDSWEGVWYRAVKIYDDHINFEMKIPFKTIRYKKGLTEWGIQFLRHIAANLEDDYWTEISQVEEELVSKWGTLKNINPQASGYYFELFPEAYFRYDKDDIRDTTIFKPRASLNFKWDVTPQTTINTTLYPDFAQIESDPFTLNLSRYPTFLRERRPFFIEGQDIFRMSDYGDNGPHFFEPLTLFYSRRIGKSLNGEVVPIIGGLKVTNKSQDWNLGTLGAYTDEYTDTLYGYNEPDRWFGVFRAKRRILENSDIGMLVSSTVVDRDNYNYAGGLDGVFRQGRNQMIVQGAFSDRNKKRGWALSSGYQGYVVNLFSRLAIEAIDDSFDVSDIGFVPWVGRKQFSLASGPLMTFQQGFMRSLYVAPSINVLQNPGEDNWSVLGGFEINPNFRRNWGSALAVSAGRFYEQDTNYFYRAISLDVWGTVMGNVINFGCNYSYSYNYARGFLAYQGGNYFFMGYSIIPPMSIVGFANLWIEWDQNNEIIAMWPLFRPKIDIRFNADMGLTIFNEFVMSTQGSDFGTTELISNRLGALFSWNFKPKSWLYIALNDYRAQDETGTLQPQYQIGAVKVKYLVYF